MGKRTRRHGAQQKVVEHVKGNPLSDCLQTIIDPRIARNVERLCEVALQVSGNSPEVRQCVSHLSQEVTLQARARFGHGSLDSNMLTGILRRTDPDNYIKKPRPDPLSVIECELDPMQLSAAKQIREVWRAFGRLLVISTRGYDGGGGSGMRKASALQPVDLMSDETWKTWQRLYIPWHNGAKNRKTWSNHHGGVPNTEIVFRIIVEEFFPEELDGGFGLEPGDAKNTLKRELSLFYTSSGLADMYSSEASEAAA